MQALARLRHNSLASVRRTGSLHRGNEAFRFPGLDVLDGDARLAVRAGRIDEVAGHGAAGGDAARAEALGAHAVASGARGERAREGLAHERAARRAAGRYEV